MLFYIFVMERIISCYTSEGYRDLVHEGTFLVTDDISIGDFILTHHVCRFTGERILQEVFGKSIAYFFNDVPVYNYLTKNGLYKCNLKLISRFDSLVRVVPRDPLYSHLYTD